MLPVPSGWSGLGNLHEWTNAVMLHLGQEVLRLILCQASGNFHVTLLSLNTYTVLRFFWPIPATTIIWHKLTTALQHCMHEFVPNTTTSACSFCIECSKLCSVQSMILAASHLLLFVTLPCVHIGSSVQVIRQAISHAACTCAYIL